ncbi:MAG: lipid-A-disaccharide synthase [Pseudomonadota bacterium]
MKVFVIAGEASGDRLGAALMAGLSTLTDPRFEGVGGPLMQAQGLRSLFPMEELSVMGLVEILPKYFHLKRRISETAKAVIAARPDVLIGIDSPDFCLRVARLVKADSDTRVVHYVAPSVWAWRPKRAQRMVGVVDQVLALLPFEPPYMQAVGIDCDFVGHPVAEDPRATAVEIAAFRAETGLGDAPVLLVLPGSRAAEVARMGPIFGEVVTRVLAARTDLRVVVPTTQARAAQISDLVAHWPGAPVIVRPDAANSAADASRKRAAFAAGLGALAASGTVSLELAAAQTPMVIGYDTNRITREIMRRMLKIDTLTLVNLVTDSRTIPEFLGQACRPELIAPAVLDMLEHPGAQRDAMRLTMDRLGRGGAPPGLRAARAVLDRMPDGPGA